MSFPQSSSNLQNYISSGSHPDTSIEQGEESNSECFDCQKITKIENHSSSSNSSGDDGELVQPLHRHIVEHSRQIEKTIFHLQSEIEHLKKANSTKDILIDQLKTELKELHTSKIIIKQEKEEEAKEIEFLRRQKEVEKIRRELIESSQKAINLQRLSEREKINDSFDDVNELKERLKNIEIKFEDRTVSRPETINKQKIKYIKKIEVSSVEDSESESSFEEENQQNRLQKNLPPNQKQSKPLKKEKRIEPTNKQIYTNCCEQNFPSSANLNDEIKTYIEKIERLESHIQFCEEEMLWMSNFIVSFLRMSDKFMTMFKESVIKQHWTMKKKTKVAWRYAKHLLGWFVRVS